MAGGPEGKIVYLHLHSAENDYYNCYDVLQTKSNIRGMIGTIFNFVMCCTQNHTFTMSCRQISLIVLHRVCLDHFAFCIFAFLEGNLQYLKY